MVKSGLPTRLGADELAGLFTHKPIASFGANSILGHSEKGAPGSPQTVGNHETASVTQAKVFTA